eukprot:g32317.t1
MALARAWWLIPLVAAQDLGLPVIPRQIPRRVGIINESPTPGAWVVNELKLYFTETCDEVSLLEPASSADIYDSGTRLETALFTTGAYAFDNVLSTNWTADCMVQLGGCQAATVGLGIDISFTEAYAEAVTERESVWSILGPLLEAITVKCIHIFQSDFGAGQISRQEQSYSAATKEVEFFEDDLCTFQLSGAIFSVGSDKTSGVSPSIYSERNVFDGNVSSFWIAKCDPIPGSLAPVIWGDGLHFDGCEPEQAYVGLEFDMPQTVRCVRLFQNVPRDIFERESRRSWTEGFALQRWTGVEWKMEEQFWDPKVTNFGDPKYAPTFVLPTPFIGNAPGGPKDTSVQNAYDGDTRQDLTWTSSCSKGLGNSCMPGEAWLGIYVRGQQPDVKCFKLLQSKNLNEQSSFVSLHVYLDGQWRTHSMHPEIGGGTWNRRPAPQWSLWRIRNNNEILGQWQVSLGEDWTRKRERLKLGHGKNGREMEERYWIGVELPADAVELQPDAQGTMAKENVVRCFRVWQSERLDRQMVSAQVQIWNGEIYTMSPVTDTGSLQDLGGGVWSRPAASFMTKWRLIPDDPTDRLWRLMEPWMRGGGEIEEPWVTAEEVTLAQMEGKGKAQVLVWLAQMKGKGKGKDPTPRRKRGKCVDDSLISEFEREISKFVKTPSVQECPTVEWERSQSGCLALANGEEHEKDEVKKTKKGKGMASEETETPKGKESEKKKKKTTEDLTEMPKGKEKKKKKEEEEIEMPTVKEADKKKKKKEEEVPKGKKAVKKKHDEDEEEEETAKRDAKKKGRENEQPKKKKKQQTEEREDEDADAVDAAAMAKRKRKHAKGDEVEESDEAPRKSPKSDEPRVPRRISWADLEEEDGDGEASTKKKKKKGDNPQATPLGFEQFENFRVGCNVSDAWVGVDLGTGKTEQNVRCLRIYQAGYELMQSPSAWVSKWDGRAWVQQWRMDGLGGSDWNRRPAAGNSMWRLQYLSRKDEACPSQLLRITHRPWGVADLKFFSDDDCLTPIEGGRTPITSGGFDFFQPSVADQISYHSSRIVDKETEVSTGLTSQLTTWAANCRTGFLTNAAEDTNCSGAWVGLQWQKAHEVRCVTLVQSRWEASKCCDAADRLELQRWNGSMWVEASWFRRPPPPAVPTENNVRPPVHLGATFKNIGICPIWEEALEEKRSRRDSETCIVKLTGAVPLLAEPGCIKHERCRDVVGNEGTCCPIGDLVESANRCCCGFLGGEPVFLDEYTYSDARDKLSFEYATIWMSKLGLCAGLRTMQAIAMVASGAVSIRVLPHSARDGMRRTYLRISRSETSKFIRWFILPNGRTPRPLELYRSLLFLAFGSVFAGMAPWLLLGAVLGEMMIGSALQLCQVIRYFKSPFDPLDLRDMQLRQEVSRVKVKYDDGMASALDVAVNVAATFVFGLAYFGKFIFDLLIVRAQMLSFEAIENIEADKVVELFPGLLETLREPAMLLYDA